MAETVSDLSICLPFAPPAHGGGGYGFLRMWEAWLTKEGIPWSRKLSDRHPVLFVNSWQTLPVRVRIARRYRRSFAVVHRVDGWPPLYGRTDGIERRLRAINKYANLTIYQSHWARRVMSGHLQDGPVIYNPVDAETFRPAPDDAKVLWPSPDFRANVIAVSWSDNPMKGGAAIRKIAGGNLDVCFRLIGRWPQEAWPPNVVRQGIITKRPELVRYLQAADALLTMSQHEACPNHVLEAMACGLPVLYLDSGATRELVGGCGVPITEDDFADGLRFVRGLWGISRPRALQFAPDIIFPQYLDAIQKAMR